MRILMPNEHSYMVSVLEEWNGWFRIDNPIQVLDTEEDLYCDGEMPTLWIHSSLLGCTTRVDVQLLFVCTCLHTYWGRCCCSAYGNKRAMGKGKTYE